jgi:transcriptional regulator with XRE-family HTH domain
MTFRNIGKALAILRQKRGLSQAELAEMCEVGRSQISRYEAGRELMKLGTLERILAVLAVEPEDLFRFVRSLGEASTPHQERARNRIEDRQLADAFQNLHTAIDELQQVVERSIEPATRFARLIDEAAGARGSATGAPDT